MEEEKKSKSQKPTSAKTSRRDALKRMASVVSLIVVGPAVLTMCGGSDGDDGGYSSLGGGDTTYTSGGYSSYSSGYSSGYSSNCTPYSSYHSYGSRYCSYYYGADGYSSRHCRTYNSGHSYSSGC